MRTGATRRPRVLPAAAVLAAVLSSATGCQLGNGKVADEFAVDFDNPFATAARDQVRTACGSLPGISAETPRSKDTSVYFDIAKASDRQVSVLSTCVNNLSDKDKALGIRGYRIDDGSQS